MADTRQIEQVIENVPPDVGIVVGIDIGYSAKRETTSASVLEWGDGTVSIRVEKLPASTGERRKSLREIFGNGKAMCVALDGPIRGGMDIIGEYRDAEMMLTRGLARYIGKPGQASSGNGICLNKATNEVARLLLDEGFVAEAGHCARIMDKAIVEAFPTSFLGVMFDQDQIPQHGARSDAYFNHLLGPDSQRPRIPHVNRLADLIRLLLPDHELNTDELSKQMDHDNRAAVVCAVTALCVAVRQYVAVGDRKNGYIILPPRAKSGRAGLQDWAWDIIRKNQPDKNSEAIIHEPHENAS